MPLSLPSTLLQACIGGCCWLVASSILTRFPVFSSIVHPQHRAIRCKVFAHRGAACGALENKMQAFEAAVRKVSFSVAAVYVRVAPPAR
jgi:hypothetical protein